MQEKKIIAVFGGSFNPPLKSHIMLAKEIIAKCDSIEKLIFVPVSSKYPKQELMGNKHRYNMLKLICDNEDKLEVSDIELKANRQLFTIETLDILKQKYIDKDIYFIMGTDNLKELQTWNSSNRILKDYRVIVLERGNDNLDEIILNNEFLNKNRESLIKIEGLTKTELSSTLIREKLKRGENIEHFVSKEVLEYIYNNNLYGCKKDSIY